MIPAFSIIGALFIPLGVVILVSSLGVQQYAFDYTNCLIEAPIGGFADAPTRNSSGPFQWKRTGADHCELRFTVTEKIPGPVFFYYRLEDFYQNNRSYVNSYSPDQLKGDAVAKCDLESCSPLVSEKGSDRVFYPCGLIANSYFSDIYDPVVNQDSGKEVVFSPKGITWSSDKKIFKPTKYSLDQIQPPPSWIKNFPELIHNGQYIKIPEIWNDERFQVWMRVAAFPTFRKLYGKHRGSMEKGVYTIHIRSNYDVTSFSGRKAVIITNGSWVGGGNVFLGCVYLAVGGLCILLAALFLTKHIIAPR